MSNDIDIAGADHALLPCPFCGGRARFWEPFDGKYSVHCENKKCRVSPSTWTARVDNTNAEAVCAAWNCRASPSVRPQEPASGET